MSLRGPAGERGMTGDHGQHGDPGDEGVRGVQGLPGIQGVTGARGVQGVQGLRGKALTWTQALVMFLLIVLIGVVLAFTVERQQRQLIEQQKDLAAQLALIREAQVRINENSRKIAEQRYQSCLGGVEIIAKLNASTRALIEIERRAKDPLAKERIKARQKGLITLPIPPCPR